MAVLQELTFQSMPATTGTSASLAAGHVSNKTVYLFGGDFTADINVSHDGVGFATVASSIAVPPGVVVPVQVPETAKFLQIDVTAHTAGAPAALLLAHSSVDGA